MQLFNSSNFVDIMVLELANETYFRWFDSGDLQSVSQGLKIVHTAQRTPHVKHWVPTKENALWKRVLDAVGVLPKNLILRISAPMKDQVIKSNWNKHSSSVQTKDASVKGRVCPAPNQNNTCGDCRACWDKRVTNIVYKEH